MLDEIKDWHGSQNGLLKEKCYNNAKEFLSSLDKLIDYSTEIDDGWVFRGHADSLKWKLLPQTFRDKIMRPTGSFSKKWSFPLSNPLDQLNKEADYLINFAKLCDEVGIQIPMPQSFYNTMTKWGKEIIDRFDKSDEDIGYYWDSKYHEALAYGQHYGIPTRLLDFTKNPLYAAFFAINENLAKLEVSKEDGKKFSSDRLCVWAVNLKLLKNSNLFSYKRNNNEDYKGKPLQRFKTIRMPWAKNTFLKQQEGLFIIDIGAEFIRAINKTGYEPIEAIVENKVVENSEFSPNEHILLKIELEAKESIIKEAFALLRQKNITQAKLKPTLQNVVSTMDVFDKIGIILFK